MYPFCHKCLGGFISAFGGLGGIIYKVAYTHSLRMGLIPKTVSRHSVLPGGSRVMGRMAVFKLEGVLSHLAGGGGGRVDWKYRSGDSPLEFWAPIDLGWVLKSSISDTFPENV